jgi:bacterioferritin
MEQQTPDRGEFVDKLNRDLTSEFRSIVQYVQHINSIKGAEYQQVVGELREHISQELEHAMTLAGQIDFLGGTPSCSIPPIEAKDTPAAALNQDLDLEERQLDRYRERISEANALGLPDVAEALTPLLVQTQAHVHDLRRALGQQTGATR